MTCWMDRRKTMSSRSFSPERTARVTVEEMKQGLMRMMETDTKTLNFNMNSAYPNKNTAAGQNKEIQNIHHQEDEEINIIPKA